MTFSRSRIAVTAILALSIAAATGCTLVNKIRAKNELNETAQSYKDGHIEEAEAHARKALSFDPDNRTAKIFIARVVHQQYKQGVETPENIAKAKEAIGAYQEVLKGDPNNEEAYKGISFLYASIKDDQNFRQWILKRATDANQPNEKRAEAWAILAGKDWDCSIKITELPEVKQTSSDGGPKVTYKKPKDQKDFDKIQHCVAQGLEEAETAIKFDSNNESAWVYKTNLLVEAAKIDDMNGDAGRKADHEKQAAVARKRAATLTEERRKKEEAAAASPTPGG